MKYPFEKQKGRKDCGVTCLSMIIKYYKGFYPISKLRVLTNTTSEGVSAYDLIEGAKKIGFDSVGYKSKIEDIDKKLLPVIAYTIIDNSYQHFVVIYEIKKNKILIGDPSSRLKYIKIDEFNKIFQNVIITLIPKVKIGNYKEECYLKKIIKYYILSNKKVIIKSIILSIISILINVLVIILFKFSVSNYNNFDYILIMALIVLISSFFKVVIDIINQNLNISFLEKIDTLLHKSVIEKIFNLPHQYYRNRTTGEILSRTSYLDRITNFVSESGFNLIFNVLLTIVFLLLILIINKLLFLIVFTFIMILIFLLRILDKKRIYYMNDCISKLSNYNSILTEGISGFETVKGLSIEDSIYKNTMNKYINFMSSKKMYLKNENKVNNIKQIFYLFINVISIIIGSYLVKNYIITLADYILFYSILSNLNEPVLYLLNWYNSYKECFYQIENIEDLTEIYCCVNENYECNLNLSNGNKILLLGPSGSGKSTLLKNIKYNSNLKNVIYISQNEVLFTDTIYNNITIGSSNLSEYKKVIKICKIDKLIQSKKLKENTLIEENGFNLSGGEKQRIVLARSLLKKPDILLIDEGLSQVNNDLERKILKNIINTYKSMNIIFVSHKDSNKDLFNQVVRLESEVYV